MTASLAPSTAHRHPDIARPPAHEHEHHHGHEHELEHGHHHGHGVRTVRPGPSLLRASVTVRLAIAGGLSGLIWLAVVWARLPIGGGTP